MVADKSYLDGFNYQNPGFVRTNLDTFYYGGDTKALNLYLDKLSKIQGLNISVAFCKTPGKVNRHLRADAVLLEKLSGKETSALDGQPCSWLVSITPKDWVHSSKLLSEVRIVIFLGDKRIDINHLQLPKWDS